MSHQAAPDLWVDATSPLRALGRISTFAGRIAIRTVRPPWHGHLVLESLWTTTIRCVVPVIAVCAPFGMVMSLQGLEIFRIFGAQRLLSSLVSVAILRELAPVMASVLVAAQGGSSCTAELATMRIKEELDATEVMAVDSIQYHVVPRFLALTLACPLLYVAGAAAGIAGGFATAVWVKGETAGVYLSELWTLTGPADVWGGVAKTLIFGAIIGLVACYHGFHARGGAAGVGRAVNDTVVHSVVAFIIANYFLTSAFFGGQTL
ncbi:MAG: ABC transporter permease [Oligoflexia bacterium]|nr:ABC transporter permease [Oligoflexia bacterium]